MNPVGLVLRLFNIIGMGDVGRFYFENKKMSRCVIYGPGSFIILGENTFESCAFHSCDFIEIPEGCTLYAALPLRGCRFSNVRFENVTILASSGVINQIKKANTGPLGVNEIHGVPATYL